MSDKIQNLVDALRIELFEYDIALLLDIRRTGFGVKIDCEQAIACGGDPLLTVLREVDRHEKAKQNYEKKIQKTDNL